MNLERKENVLHHNVAEMVDLNLQLYIVEDYEVFNCIKM